MKTTIEIDIDNFLSDEDKKEIAQDLFRDELRNGFLASQEHRKNTENYERVIYNSVHYFLEEEMDKIFGTNHKEMLSENLKKILNKNLEFVVFKNTSPWTDKKSVAQEMLDNLVLENKSIAEAKVKEALENIKFDNIEDYFAEILKDAIIEKLKK